MQMPWESPSSEPADPPLASSPEPTDRGLHAAEAYAWVLSAVLRGELPVAFHYQPIVDLRRGTVAGYEALARLPSILGPGPDVCFAIAASHGKRLELELAVARAALLGRARLPRDCFYSINLSAAFLVSGHWQSLVAAFSDLGGIVIEITEEESISDYDLVRARLAHIRSLGGAVAVDDAGSGYASLKHIVEMKPSFVKLDRELVSNCHAEPAKSVLIEMIGQAANRLDAWVIAEGIELPQELHELIHLGLPLGQGYLLGRPDPVMQPLPDARAQAIRERRALQSSSHTLCPLVEPCSALPTSAAALRHLDSAGSALVSTCLAAAVVDQWNRPLQLLERHPALGIRVLADPMRVQLATDPAEVLHRALTRPAASRFDPCAVIDAQGQLQGIVRIDRLMRALLRPAAPIPAEPLSLTH